MQNCKFLFAGLTALHSAIISGKQEFTKVLIEQGVGLDNQDGKSGRTALHYAAEASWPDIVQMLLERGASVCMTLRLWLSVCRPYIYEMKFHHYC